MRLAPESSVVAVQAGAQWSTSHKQLGARVIIAVGVHSVGEGVDVREVAPPRLVMTQPAFPCGELEDALSRALPVPAG